MSDTCHFVNNLNEHVGAWLLPGYRLLQKSYCRLISDAKVGHRLARSCVSQGQKAHMPGSKTWLKAHLSPKKTVHFISLVATFKESFPLKKHTPLRLLTSKLVIHFVHVLYLSLLLILCQCAIVFDHLLLSPLFPLAAIKCLNTSPSPGTAPHSQSHSGRSQRSSHPNGEKNDHIHFKRGTKCGKSHFSPGVHSPVPAHPLLLIAASALALARNDSAWTQ